MIKTVIVILLLVYQCMPSTYKKEKTYWYLDGRLECGWKIYCFRWRRFYTTYL
jgi:hypothetical protein